jgi:hypothetical protein
MAAEALLEANLRLAETPEFALSDTDRLGLFVVSRLAQRQNVRVSLHSSPFGGVTAIVFIPDALLTDDVPDTNGIGFRLDRAHASREAGPEVERRAALSEPVRLPGLQAPLPNGPVAPETPVEPDAQVGVDDTFGCHQDALDDEDGERGGLFRPRRPIAGVLDEEHPRGEGRDEAARLGDTDPHRPGGPAPVPQRRLPELVSRRHMPEPRRGGEEPRDGRATEASGLAEPKPLPTRRGDQAGLSILRPVDGRESRPRAAEELPALPQRRRTTPSSDATPGADTARGGAEPGRGPLPRRVRQASLAPQLRDDPARHFERDKNRADRAHLAGRDADEVRSRMASLQRGWQRGREKNAAGEDAQDGSTRPTTEGDDR